MGWGGGWEEGEEKSEWFNILVLHQATGLPVDVNLLSGIAIAVMGCWAGRGGGEE